ncbi:methyl-accepting chemotaxis protein [Caenibacillus caldisaponilyticus]|uniref:methyl-accepting chemotaxis protein n=1 Tax=Caenibacillus caldisaponilyticus TaxID=1674942 RepID=UPI00130169B3|nr:methyl-accepting chemotaxis protein [Caenibacillus caldisaponilyticus]
MKKFNIAKFKDISLKNKIALIALPVVLLGFVFVILTSISSLKATMSNDLKKELESVGILTAYSLDGSVADQIEAITNEKDENFKNVQKVLDDIMKQQKVMSWSYVWKANDDNSVVNDDNSVVPIAYTKNLNSIYHAGKKFDNLADVHIKAAKKAMKTGKPVVTDIFKDPYGTWRTVFTPVKDSAGKTVGLLGIDYSANYIKSEINKAVIKQLIVSLLAVLVIISLIFLVIRRVMQPLGSVVKMADRISEGDLSLEKLEIKSNDEIGKLSRSFNDMVENLRQLIKGIMETTKEVARSSDALAENASKNRSYSENIVRHIDEVANKSQDAHAMTEESLRAMEESASGVQKIAEHSGHVAETAVKASNLSKEGNAYLESIDEGISKANESVQMTNRTIHTLNEKMNEIGKIVEFLTEIAEQTNMLALNAAIEAARAGEHGKGFAVVAENVKKLAEESRANADKITDIIRDVYAVSEESMSKMAQSQEDVEEALRLVKETQSTFAQIIKASEEVSAQIQEVSAASEEISASVEEVSASVNEISTISGKNAENTHKAVEATSTQLKEIENIEAASQALRRLANDLNGLAEKFKI